MSLQMPRGAVARNQWVPPTDVIDEIPKVTMPLFLVIGESYPAHSAKGARWRDGRLSSAELIKLTDYEHDPIEALDQFDAASPISRIACCTGSITEVPWRSN
jgi:non-heme chloroperoxidase